MTEFTVQEVATLDHWALSRGFVLSSMLLSLDISHKQEVWEVIQRIVHAVEALWYREAEMRTKTIKVLAIDNQDQITESPGYLAYRRTWYGLEVNTACDIRIIFQRIKTIMITVWTELQENPMSRTICNFALYWFLFGFIEHDRSTCYYLSPGSL